MKPLSHRLWLSCIAVVTTSGVIITSPVFSSQPSEGAIASPQLAQVSEQSTSAPAI
ncbi:MAG: hypothetical protein SFY66_24915 [Oculatellaceae cyanobacterium bins.114]|nr:hypothetical protein [Oculatellaceae cyanobacterium bins.114]